MKRPVANFDRIARLYQWMECLSFGRSLAHCRNYFLPQLSQCRTALVLGDGDGRFLARLLTANPALHADAVDTSSAMLRLLEARANTATTTARTRVRTHQTNALTFAPDHPCDLIVTHFFLDCLTPAEVDQLARRISPYLTHNALWLISDFRIPDGRMRWPARVIVRVLYIAFRLLTGLRTNALPDHAPALTAAGFRRRARRLSLGGLLTSELWEHGIAAPPAPEHLPYNIDSL